MADNLLGAYLRELRKQNGYSQEFVASKLNVIRQTYSHYETGRIMPPIDSLYHLAKLYRISADMFLELAMKNDEEDPEYESVSISYSSPAPFRGEAPPAEEEEELLRCYRLLDSRDRADILEFLRIKCRRIKKSDGQ